MKVVIGIFLLLVTLSAFNPPPFTGPADVLDSTFTPKPEWNFLFLYEALKFFPGSLEVIGTVGIPTLVILILFSLPFLDKREERNPLKRPATMIGGSVFVALVLILTVIGSNSKEKTSLPPVKAQVKKSFALSPSALKGKSLFATYGCTACHTMSGAGGKIGPDLTNESQTGHTKDWILVQLTDSKKHNPKSILPPFTMLSKEQLSDLADYLLSPHPAGKSSSAAAQAPASNTPGGNTAADTSNASQTVNPKSDLPGPAADIIGNVSHGALLYRQDCESCHGVNGKGGIPDPGTSSGMIPALNPISKDLYSSDPQTFAENIDKFIQHGAVPAGPNPAIKMFDYGDSYTLTQMEIAHLEAYILNLNGVNRARLQVTSFSPKQYFFIIAAVFLFLCAALLFFYLTKKRRMN